MCTVSVNLKPVKYGKVHWPSGPGSKKMELDDVEVSNKIKSVCD